MRLRWGIGLMMGLQASAAWGQGPAASGGLPQRDMSVQLGTRLRYDSNVLRGFRGPTGTAGRTDDFSVSPSVTVSLLQPISRQDLFLSGSVGYDFYRYNKRLNRERIDLTGGAHLRAGQRCAATPSVGYQRALSDLGDLVGIDGVLSRVNVQETINYGVDANCGGVFGLNVSGGYRHSETRNSAPFRRALNVNTDTYNASVGLASRSIGIISVYGSYLDGSYPDRIPGTILDPGRGIRTYSAGGRYERRIGTYFSALVSLGWTHVAPRDSTVDGFDGLSYQGDISYTRDPLSLKFGFSRNAEQSNLIQSSYSISTQVSASGEYAVNERLRLTGGASYGRRRFVQPPDFVPIVVAPRLRDESYSGSVGLRYSLLRQISLTLDGGYQVRRSMPDVFNFKSTQVTLGLRWDL